MVIYQDNQSAIALVGSGQTSWKNKHIEVQFHYTQDKIADKTIQVEYYSTDKIIADGLTKILAPEQFTELRDKIMMLKNIVGALGKNVRIAMRLRLKRHW